MEHGSNKNTLTENGRFILNSARWYLSIKGKSSLEQGFGAYDF